MLYERRTAIFEDIAEAESVPELDAMVRHWELEFPEAIANVEIMTAVENRKMSIPVPVAEDNQSILMGLLEQLQKLKTEQPTIERAQITRSSRKYKLLKTELDWTTKPQIHAVMRILSAHAKLGDVLDEGDIVEMMVANESVLNTRQGGKRVWNYYKGDHFEGLCAHGNIQKL
jgi:hypothetical protein